MVERSQRNRIVDERKRGRSIFEETSVVFIRLDRQFYRSGQ